MQATINFFVLTTEILLFVLIALVRYRSMHIFYMCVCLCVCYWA